MLHGAKSTYFTLIVVSTNLLLQEILGRAKALGRMRKWVTMLSKFDISYRPKLQLGSSLGYGARVVLTNLKEDKMQFAVKFDFRVSNNEAKYEALILGIKMAMDAGAKHLESFSHLQLVLCQVIGTFECWN
ncbi:UNVERIFIED_CONTAM: hypothetical protein Slati_0948600 [Sesamum latifolium]|uniref:RNase H type-1 domain-containing protein n=1 Tax=Sesamum latifolium TaxID=2727402 RepID=A0AAW2XPK6_9LAMI